jgi:hypothetical protein
MPVQNAEIAAMFDQAADLREIKGENQFCVRAYRRAARTIEGSPESMRTLLRYVRLTTCGERSEPDDCKSCAASVRLVFTYGATSAVNLLAFSFGNQLSRGNEVLLSILEHQSNLVPWQ